MRLLAILIVALLFPSLETIAQTAQENAAASKQVITKDSPSGVPIDQDAVDAFTKKIQKYLDADFKKYEKASYMKYSFRLDELQQWINYRFIEADSEIDLSWFKKLHEFVNFFYETKREYDLSSLPDTSKIKSDNKIKFESAIKIFDVLVSKPTKANKQRVDYLKREKKKYLDEKQAISKKKK